MKTARTKLLARLALVASISAGLAACGGSNNHPEPDAGPTLAERQATQQTAITEASGGVTAALANLNTSTPNEGQLADLETAIAALEAAIDDAEDLSESAKATVRGQLGFAQTAASTAKANIEKAATEGRIMAQKGAIATALSEVMKARNAFSSPLPTPGQLDALQTAIEKLDDAIMGADDVPTSDLDLADANTALKNARTLHMTAEGNVAAALKERREKQAGEIGTATALVIAARTNLKEGSATPELVDRLEKAIMRLEGAISDAEDWTSDEQAIQDANALVADATADLTVAQGKVADSRTAKMVSQRTAIGTAASRVETAIDALGTPPTQDQVTELENAIVALEAAIGDADALGESELQAHRATVSSAKALRMAKQEEVDAIVVANRKKMNQASMKVAEAINAHKPDGYNRTGSKLPKAFDDGTTDTKDTEDGLKVSLRVGDKPTITLNDPESKASKEYEDPTHIASIGEEGFESFAGARYDLAPDAPRKGRDFKELAVIYTDIEENGDEKWAAYFGDSTKFGANAVDANTGRVVITSTGAHADELRDASRFDSVIIPDAVPDSGSDSKKNVYEITSNTEGNELDGFYFGVEGDFSCGSGDNCKIERGKGDTLTITGTLYFTPDTKVKKLGDIMAVSVVQDSDYTHFGFWKRDDEQRDETYTHSIETFHGGAGFVSDGDPDTEYDSNSRDLHMVEGTANYYGAAAGVYVKKDGTGDEQVVTDGTFTADAMLKAYFGGSAIAADDQFMVSGTISDFTDGSEDLGFDELTLEKASFYSSGSAPSSASVTENIKGGETNGGGTSGNWIGTFFGDAGTKTTTDGDAHKDDYPLNVSGEFNGHFSNGHVAGAFGAQYDDN